MSSTIPHDRSRRPRRLAVVPDVTEAARAASDSAAETLRLAVEYASRPRMNPSAELRLDQAELFLLSLDTEMLTADSLRAAYLLGLAEIHLAGLIEIVRGALAS